MTKVRWAIVLAGIAACVTKPDFAGLVVGPRKATFQERIEVTKLDNGLRVALLPDARTNLVGVEVRYEVGGADDPPDASVLAHYVEHLLFAAGIAGGGRDVTLDANAVTSSDRTLFFATALDTDLDALLAIAARRLEATCTDLPAAALARERDVVIEEAKQRGPFAWHGQAVGAAIWGDNHPYARAVGGEAFAHAPPATVCDFIAQHYGPASATVVVTGHVADGELARIRARFEHVAARPQAARWAGLPLATGDTRVVTAGLRKPTALLVFPVPGEGGSADAAVTVLDGMTWTLDDGARTRRAHVFALGEERARVLIVSAEVDSADELPDLADAMRRTFAKPRIFDFAARQQLARRAFVARFDDVIGAGLKLAELLAHGQRLTRYATLEAIDQLTEAKVTALLDVRASRMIFAIPDHPTAGTHQVSELSTELHQIDVPHARADTDLTPPPLPAARVDHAVVEDRLANGLRVWLAPDPDAIAIDARLVADSGPTADDDERMLAFEAAMFLDSHSAKFPGQDAEDNLRWYASVGVPVTRRTGATTTFGVSGFGLFGDWHVWNLWWTVLHGGYPPVLDYARHGDFDRDSPATAGSNEPPSAFALARARVSGQPDEPKLANWHPHARADLDAFRHAAYQPSTSTLIVSGKFELEPMRAEVARLFGAWHETATARSSHAAIRPTVRAPSFVAIAAPDATTVELAIAFAPPADSPRIEAAARAVLTEILNDRLRDVREGLGVSYGVYAQVGPTAVIVGGDVEPAYAATAAHAIGDVIAKVRDGDADLVADFVRARKRVLARAIAEPIGASHRATQLEQIAADHGALDQPELDLEAIQQLDLDAVRRLATRDLRADRMIACARGPDPTLAPVLAALGAPGGNIERIAAPARAR